MRSITLEEDIRAAACAIAQAGSLENCTVLVTGASGLIGSLIVRALVLAEKEGLTRGVKVLALARNRKKLEEAVGPEDSTLTYLIRDLSQGLDPCPETDYIFHCASPTASSYFCTNPVETIAAICSGTSAVLKHCAGNRKLKKMVYLSSCEVYGKVEERIRIREDYQGYIDPLSVRSSYSLGKRMAECLCCSYHAEYGVPVVIARLTQTFGAGISAEDGRVFAQFARSVVEGRDIILHTEGKSSKSYIYTTDAVSALFTLLFKAEPGRAYNVANEDSYCSIREMAEMLARMGDRTIKVKKEVPSSNIYPPDTHLDLDCGPLKELGWKPALGLEQMYRRLINYLSSGNERIEA